VNFSMWIFFKMTRLLHFFLYGINYFVNIDQVIFVSYLSNVSTAVLVEILFIGWFKYGFVSAQRIWHTNSSYLISSHNNLEFSLFVHNTSSTANVNAGNIATTLALNNNSQCIASDDVNMLIICCNRCYKAIYKSLRHALHK
jgi:hypothetical protein